MARDEKRGRGRGRGDREERDEFVDKLVEGGLDEPTAQCITDGIQAAGIDLNDVTDEELGDDDPPQEVIDVTFECVLGASDTDG